MPPNFKKLISLFISFCLIFEQTAFAQSIDLSHYFVHNPSQAISRSDKFRPLHLRYLGYDNLNQDFKLLLDKGDTKKEDLDNKNYIEENTQTLLKYFFIGLSLPNDKFWVNLRPDAPDNIIDDDLAKTDVGKILLEADLQLKKDTASWTSPQTPEGKAYWDKLYKKAGELFGTENITIPTLTRPWIVPGEIIIRETIDSSYIYKATLRVMLEQDYLTSRGGSRTAPTPDQYNFSDPRLKELNQYSTQLIKELIIPKLTQEINSSKRYAPLRQVYYSLILAQWFKARYANKDTAYSHLINRKDLTNLFSKESWSKSTYFKQYQKSFKDGEYNISEPVYTPYGQTIRSYFSGGISIVSNSPAVLPAATAVAGSPILNQYLIHAVAVYDNAAGQANILTQTSASPEKLNQVSKTGQMKFLGIRDPIDEDVESDLSRRHPEFETLAASIQVEDVYGMRARVVSADLGNAGAYHFNSAKYGLIIVVTSKHPDIWEEGKFHEAREVYWMSKGFNQHEAHAVASAEQVMRFSQNYNLTPYHLLQIQNMTFEQRQAIQVEDIESRRLHHNILWKAIRSYGADIKMERIRSYEEILRFSAAKMTDSGRKEGISADTEAAKLRNLLEEGLPKLMMMLQDKEAVGVISSQRDLVLREAGIISNTLRNLLEQIIPEKLPVSQEQEGHIYELINQLNEEYLLKEDVGYYISGFLYPESHVILVPHKIMDRKKYKASKGYIETIHLSRIGPRYRTTLFLDEASGTSTIGEKTVVKIRRDVHEKEAAKIIGALRGDNFYENIPLKRYESITKQVMNKEFGALSKEEIARILELKTELHEIRHKEFEINGLFLNAREMESENEILTELAVLAVGPAVYYQLFHVFEGTKAMLAPEYYNDIMRLLAKHLKIDDAGNYEVLFDRLLKKSAEEIRKAASDAYYEFGEKFSVGEIDQGALRMAVQSGIREEGNVQEKAYTTGISSLSAPKNTDDPGDLSEHDFIRLTPKESISKKSAKWHDVKDLDDNNPEKILYFRRFAGEFQPSVSLSPELAKSLQRKDYFGYYALDEAQRVRLSAVSPYTTKLSIPPGVKIGIVVGYHHLEKPWGHLFRAMFEKQVRFPPGSVQFIVIKNGDIPTGDRSVSSEREIQDAVIREGLTHIIDVHEQLSYLNHYMDFSRASEFNDVFRAGDRKNQRGKEYTLDPFVPLWAIEQYYGGYIYPQLQYAVNEQIRKIEILVRNISETSPESSLPSGSSSLVNNSVPFSTITALDNPGGIDFRTLPIVTQAISNLSLDMFHMPLNRLDDLNLNQEWLQIQKIAGAGITPSAERIKEYVQLSCLKGELNDTQKIIACIADILRNEEERCVSTEPILKDILVVLESGRSAQELKAVFTGNQS